MGLSSSCTPNGFTSCPAVRSVFTTSYSVFQALASDELRGRHQPAVARIGRKQPLQVAIIAGRRIERVERLLLAVVLLERLGQLADRIDDLAAMEHWLLPRDLGHQLVDIFKLL